MAEKKKTRIALVNPPPPPGAFVHYQSPLIGLAYMAALLDGEGYEVTVIDCPPLKLTYEDLKRALVLFKPDVVGITSVTVTFSSAAQVARVVKEACPEALTVFGGPHVSVLDTQVLGENPQVDVVVRGEGEQTMLELIKLVTESKLEHLSCVAGVTYRKNGQIVRAPNRSFIQNLDDLPFPAYKFFPLERYRVFGNLILPVISSRGCPFRCAFCLASRMAGSVVRVRSPKNVVDELEWLKNEFAPDAFTFHDETFTYDKNRVFEICEEIRRRKIDVPWDCSTRVDQISPELLHSMKAANCQLISFGVESGSQRILNAMKKGTTVEQNERAIRLVKDAGISVTISVIVGYPGETMDTLGQTLDFIQRTEPDDVHMSLATPYPGIELTDMMKETGWKISEDWSQCDMQTSVFSTPSLPVDLREVRRQFYNKFYSVSYILRQSFRGTLYGRILARSAANQLLWRSRLPSSLISIFRKLAS